MSVPELTEIFTSDVKNYEVLMGNIGCLIVMVPAVFLNSPSSLNHRQETSTDPCLHPEEGLKKTEGTFVCYLNGATCKMGTVSLPPPSPKA